MARTPPKPESDKERERHAEAKRLAAALRDNLKRRKVAGRADKPDAERN
ncbi:MAG: hypothetical protein ACK4FG_02735 [Brevundimonas sp.]|jgi:hypothetical protein